MPDVEPHEPDPADIVLTEGELAERAAQEGTEAPETPDPEQAPTAEVESPVPAEHPDHPEVVGQPNPTN